MSTGFGIYADDIEKEDYYVAVIDNQPVLIERNIAKTISHKTNERYVWGKHRFYTDNLIDLLALDDEAYWIFAMIDKKMRYVGFGAGGYFCSRNLKESDYILELDPIIAERIENIKNTSIQNTSSESIINADSIISDTIPLPLEKEM